MYIISDLFKEFLKRSDRTIDAKVIINEVEYTGSEIVEFEIDDSIASGDNLEIGTAISSGLTLTIRTSDTIPKNARVRPYIRLGFDLEWMNANIEWINANISWAEGYTEWLPLGEFYIDERKFSEGTWKFTCCDKLILANQSYETTLTFPATMNAVLNDACTQLGVVIDSSLQINPAYMVPFNYDYTISEVIRYIAASHGACAKITKDGKLGFVKFGKNDIPVDSVTPADYSGISHDGEIKTITRIVVTYNDDGEYLEAGTGEEANTLNLYNPFITEAMLNAIYADLNGYSYKPYDMTWRCYPYLETGDRINVGYFETPAPVWDEVPIPWDNANFNWEGTGIFATVILNSKITFKGGLSGRLSAQAAAEQQAEFKGTLTRKVENLSKTTIKEDKPYYGVTVGRANGLNIKKSDGSSEVILNSDKLAFKAGGQDRLYFDPVSGKYKFSGTLEATDGVFAGSLSAATGSFAGDISAATGTFNGTVYAANISTLKGKITAAQIETNELVVGDNITLGPNARIGWNQVTNANLYSVDAWRSSGYATHIDANGLYTGMVYAHQIYGNIANLAEEVNVGDVNSLTGKAINFYNSASGASWSKIELGWNGVLDVNSYNGVELNGGYGNSIEIGTPGKDYINVFGDIEFSNDARFYGDVQLSVYSGIGFFGNAPIPQKTAARLTPLATLPEVIDKINGILGILGQQNYGLIFVY